MAEISYIYWNLYEIPLMILFAAGIPATLFVPMMAVGRLLRNEFVRVLFIIVCCGISFGISASFVHPWIYAGRMITYEHNRMNPLTEVNIADAGEEIGGIIMAGGLCMISHALLAATALLIECVPRFQRRFGNPLLMLETRAGASV